MIVVLNGVVMVIDSDDVTCLNERARFSLDLTWINSFMASISKLDFLRNANFFGI